MYLRCVGLDTLHVIIAAAAAAATTCRLHSSACDARVSCCEAKHVHTGCAQTSPYCPPQSCICLKCRDTSTFIVPLAGKYYTMGGECYLDCTHEAYYQKITLQQLTGVMPQDAPPSVAKAIQCSYMVTESFQSTAGRCTVWGRAACCLRFT